MRNDVTRANAVSERKKSFRKFEFFRFAVWTNVKRKKSVRRRNKRNIAGQVLTYKSKNFHWLNRKLDQTWTMNGLWKPFRKKSDPKNRKNYENQSEIAACEQKTTSEKANFCSNTVFSLYFKFRVKKFHAAKPLAFSLHFLLRRDQNHYSNLTSKIMKMCEQILEKNIAGRIPENTRRRKLPILMTKQLNSHCEPWTSKNAIKNWKNRNGIQKQIDQKKTIKTEFF